MAQVVQSLPPQGKPVFSPSQPQMLWASGEWWGDLFLSPSVCLSKQTAQTGKEVGTVEPPAPQEGKQNGTAGRWLIPSLHVASPRDSATPRQNTETRCQDLAGERSQQHRSEGSQPSARGLSKDSAVGGLVGPQLLHPRYSTNLGFKVLKTKTLHLC